MNLEGSKEIYINNLFCQLYIWLVKTLNTPLIQPFYTSVCWSRLIKNSIAWNWIQSLCKYLPTCISSYITNKCIFSHSPRISTFIFMSRVLVFLDIRISIIQHCVLLLYQHFSNTYVKMILTTDWKYWSVRSYSSIIFILFENMFNTNGVHFCEDFWNMVKFKWKKNDWSFITTSYIISHWYTNHFTFCNWTHASYQDICFDPDCWA